MAGVWVFCVVSRERVRKSTRSYIYPVEESANKEKENAQRRIVKTFVSFLPNIATRKLIPNGSFAFILFPLKN